MTDAPVNTIYQDSTVAVHKVVVGPVSNNVFFIQCVQTGASVMIDAANEQELLLELCERFQVGKVLETHGHWDHVAAVPEVRDAGYLVAVSKEDSSMLDGYDQIIGQGDIIPVGRLSIDVIHTPGHTPGSLTFHVRNTHLLFTGDTLFPGGPGATKFPGGDFKAIIASIKNKIFAKFDGETLILPGHGESSTIGREAPHLEAWVNRGW